MVTATLVLVAGVAAPVAAQEVTTVTATVRHAVSKAPIANATVRALPSARSCLTGGDGSCRLVLDTGNAEIRASAIGVAPENRALMLTSGLAVNVAFIMQPSAAPLDPLVTLGTRSTERTTSRSTVPVDVITAQLLQESGMPETWQQLQRLVPSVNVPHIPIGDNHMRPITLRGLAPHHVLVLVNGKRRHPAAALLAGPSVPSTALTDLGAIPNGAIERIEVLRDGAAAQYGSDAVGGVVNVVLKSGTRRDVSLLTGSVLSSEGARTFRDGRHADMSGTFGVATSGGTRVTVSGELRERLGTNRAYPDGRPQYFTNDPRTGAEPRISAHQGNGAMAEGLLFIDGGAPLGRGIEAYGFGGAAQRRGISPDGLFRRPLDGRTIRAIHPEGFLPEIVSGIGDRSAVAGVRGTARGWRWDISSGWGANRVEYTVRNSNNASLGAASPTQFDAGSIASQQWTSNADISRAVSMAKFPVHLASGIEFRVERYRIGAGEPDSWRDGAIRILDGPSAGQLAAVGAQGLLGFRPIDAISGRRSNTAVYLELEGRPLSRLLLQTAVRAERYSDFGSTSNGKVAGRLDVIRGVVARGAISTGFRAPALSQQYFSSTRTVFQLVNGVNTIRTVRTFPVHTAEARLMGATPLRPERALNHSLGLAVELPRLPLVTADWYQVRIEDRIGLSGSVTDSSIVRLLEENGMRGIAGGNYFSNSIDTRTRGLDVVAQHGVLLGRSGSLRLVAGYNRTRTAVTRVLPAPSPLARFESLLFNRTSRGIIERGQPQETMALTATYDAGPLAMTLHNHRSGPTAQLDQTNPAADQIVRARWTTDVRIAYRVRPRLQFTVSAGNLFDVYPDEWFDFSDGVQALGPSMNGISRYPGALSPFGMNGRTVYLRLVYQ